MAREKVTIAIVGAGLIGPRHAASVVKCSEASLAAFVDPSPQAQAVADSFGVPLYSSIEALLASRDRPAAAIICSPNNTHVALAKQLLSASIHVLIEKPVAISLPSATSLLSHAALCSPTKALAGHHRRFNPYITATKHALQTNLVGNPLAISGLWALRKPPSYFAPPTAWRASRASGGGPILVNLVHELDVLSYLLGPITRVYAEQTPSTRGNAVEEGAAVTLRFASGAVGTFLLSDAAPSAHSFEAGTGENPLIPRAGRDFYRILGTEGTLSVGDMRVERYAEGGSRGWEEVVVEEAVEVGSEVPFDEQVRHFVRVVRGEEEPRCSVEDGVRAVRVAEAVLRAMREGVPVEVDGDRKEAKL